MFSPWFSVAYGVTALIGLYYLASALNQELADEKTRLVLPPMTQLSTPHGDVKVWGNDRCPDGMKFGPEVLPDMNRACLVLKGDTLRVHYVRVDGGTLGEIKTGLWHWKEDAKGGKLMNEDGTSVVLPAARG